MQVILLGTGTPVPRLGMAESSLAVLTGTDVLLFDCGYGTTHRLLAAGIDPTRLTHIFFTHHHYDHNADYAHVVLSSWVLGRTTPLPVHGPEGTAAVTRALFKEVYAEDIRGRATAGRPLAAVDPAVTELQDGDGVTGDGWQVTAFRVQHGPIPALGYKIEAGDKTVVLSGDTIPVPAVTQAARGADLLVHEVHFAPGAKMKTTVDWEEWVVDRGHTTPDQVGRLAAAAGVRRLAVTHLQPPSAADAPDLVAAIRRHYSGDLIIGRDLMDIWV